jgi:predicted NodU family carbamoyl transferase
MKSILLILFTLLTGFVYSQDSTKIEILQPYSKSFQKLEIFKDGAKVKTIDSLNITIKESKTVFVFSSELQTVKKSSVTIEKSCYNSDGHNIPTKTVLNFRRGRLTYKLTSN